MYEGGGALACDSGYARPGIIVSVPFDGHAGENKCKHTYLPVTVVLHHGGQLVEYIPVVPTKSWKRPLPHDWTKCAQEGLFSIAGGMV